MLRMVRRPLIGIAVCVGIGTWLGVAVGGPWFALAGVVVSGTVCIVAHCSRHEWAAQVALLALIMLSIWFCASHSLDQTLHVLLSASGSPEGGRVEVLGTVQSDMVDAPKSSGSPQVNFLLRVHTIQINGVEHRVRDAVRVVMYGVPRYPPVYGETWELTGRLIRPRSGWSKKRIRYTLKVGLRDTRLVERTHSGFMAWCFEARREASALLSAGIEDSPDVSGVVNALLLGYRARLPDDVRNCFRHTGTMHVFAISGLHVGILCTIIIFLLGVLRVPRTAWVFVLAPLLLVYTSVTGARASAIRASAMMIAYLLAPLVRRKSDAVSAFALAAITIWIWQPEQLFDIGFLYSFSVVAGIMAIVPVFEGLLAPLWRVDPFLPIDMVERRGWWLHGLRWMLRTFSVSLAAWLTSAPLSLHFFGRFSPVALIGNCLAIPLAFLILVTACLSIVMGSALALVGDVFNHANWCFVRLLVSGMQLLERIPYGWNECPRIPVWGVALWYGVLGALVVSLRRVVARRSKGGPTLGDDSP
jgi:ComEC/Rec2-related protein